MNLRDILLETKINIEKWGWSNNKVIEKSQLKKAIQNIEKVVTDNLFDKRFEVTKEVSIVIYNTLNVEIVTDLEIENKTTVDKILNSLKKQLDFLETSK
jgi:hypothetical protein